MCFGPCGSILGAIIDLLIFFPSVFVEYIRVFCTYFWRLFCENYPKGPFPWPYYGNTFWFGNTPLKSILNLKDDYGDIMSVYLGSYPVVVISNHHLIHELLVTHESSGKPPLAGYMLGRTCKGRRAGIFCTDGEDFDEHKRFLVHKLRHLGYGRPEMEPTVVEEVKKLITTIEINRNGPIDSTNLFNLAVINCLWQFVCHDRFDASDPELERLMNAASKFTRELYVNSPIMFFPLLTKYIKCKSGIQDYKDNIGAVLQFMKNKVERYYITIENDPVVLKNKPRSLMKSYFEKMMSVYRNPESPFYEDLGKANMTTSFCDLFALASETTSATLTWAILYLILNPEIQEKLQREIDDKIIEESVPTVADRDNCMPYTKAVISEVLRHSTVIPLTPPHSMMADLNFRGYRIPKDTIIIANLYSAHRNQEFWGSDVHEFNPDRFLKITEGGLIAYDRSREEALVPFSVGRRACIAERSVRNQLFLFLVMLFKKFDFMPTTDQPLEKLQLCTECDQANLIRTPKPFKFRVRYHNKGPKHEEERAKESKPKKKAETKVQL